ncbi:MAG: flagellar type III secretion system pore protein FliP [Planctomycetota bacterium]|jgi:flagellar biosynthetic protein FliP|nr:flagellar type III secretion system pore protein FliP [Planctomycetota bacterium]
MSSLLRPLTAFIAVVLLGSVGFAQEAVEASAVLTDDPGAGSLSSAIEIAVLLTILSMLPAVLVTVTSFTRIVIVLSFVRRALGVNELPPNPVIIGLALFLTCFVMAPVAERINDAAIAPYRAEEISFEEAGENAWQELRGFLVANTREAEIQLFVELADYQDLEEGAEELPIRVVVPAFVLSELKTAFQMGFLLFLPFLVIDLVVSSILLSMGMFMLPPVMISTPFKILVFVLVDGWGLICTSMIKSFQVMA